MALLSFLPETSPDAKKQKPSSSKRRKKQKQHKQQTSSWDQIKKLLTCKQIEASTNVQHPSSNNNNNSVGYSKLSSCSSICSFRDVVHGNTRVVHRADNSPESSTVGQESALIRRKTVNGSTRSSSSRSLTGATTTSMRSNGGGTYRSASRGMQFRKLSGCYECHMAHMIVDPSR